MWTEERLRDRKLHTVVLNRWSLVGPSRALIYYIEYDKNCILLFLASFQPNVDPVSNDGDCDEYSRRSIIYKRLHALQSWARRRHSDSSLNLFTVSLLSNWPRLSVIKVLNIPKLFNHRSQDPQSRRGFDSFRGKDDWKIFHTHSLGCLGKTCNYSFAFMSRFYNM